MYSWVKTPPVGAVPRSPTNGLPISAGSGWLKRVRSSPITTTKSTPVSRRTDSAKGCTVADGSVRPTAPTTVGESATGLRHRHGPLGGARAGVAAGVVRREREGHDDEDQHDQHLQHQHLAGHRGVAGGAAQAHGRDSAAPPVRVNSTNTTVTPVTGAPTMAGAREPPDPTASSLEER